MGDSFHLILSLTLYINRVSSKSSSCLTIGKSSKLNWNFYLLSNTKNILLYISNIQHLNNIKIT